ncbi:MAG: hypothetical protein ACWGON_03530 [Gemmatimonadota bacterium]
MQNYRKFRARLPFGMPRGAAFSGLSSRAAAIVTIVLALQACAEKESSFFAPAAEEGPGNLVPAAEDLNGTWNLDYLVVSTTCEADLADFERQAEYNTFISGTWMLDVLPDGSATPIRGPYNTVTGAYTGESAPVSIGNGEFSEESWEMSFRLNSRDIPTMSGTAVERITSGGSPVCERRYDVSGARLVAVPL